MKILAKSIREVAEVNARAKSKLAKEERADNTKRKAALNRFMNAFSQNALVDAIDGQVGLYMWDPSVDGMEQELEKIGLAVESMSWADVMKDLEIGGVNERTSRMLTKCKLTHTKISKIVSNRMNLNWEGVDSEALFELEMLVLSFNNLDDFSDASDVRKFYQHLSNAIQLSSDIPEGTEAYSIFSKIESLHVVLYRDLNRIQPKIKLLLDVPEEADVWSISWGHKVEETFDSQSKARVSNEAVFVALLRWMTCRAGRSFIHKFFGEINRLGKLGTYRLKAILDSGTLSFAGVDVAFPLAGAVLAEMMESLGYSVKVSDESSQLVFSW